MAAKEEAPSRIHNIQYEALKLDTVRHVRGLADFLGLPHFSDGDVAFVVNETSLDSLRQRKWKQLHSAHGLVRKGMACGFLDEDLISQTKKLMTKAMSDLNVSLRAKFQCGNGS